MKNFIVFDKQTCTKFVNKREGETKFGEKINLPENDDIHAFLNETKSKFIIYGINESIGVKANLGRQGTESAFNNALGSLLNIQHNKICKGQWLGVLGSFYFDEEMKLAAQLSIEKPDELIQLRELVSEVDKQITYLNSIIIKAGKIPIVIGGGHNNAYGNIKGLSLAKNQSVNVINFDAHTDFRTLEGRHSGNGFSYAFDQDFLDKYFIFGLHENYTSKKVFTQMNALNERIKYNTFEEIEVRGEKEFNVQLKTAKEFVKSKPYGIEIDLDAIENVASSAITPTGFATKDVRKFIHVMGSHLNASYLHICEGAPTLDINNPNSIGKLITFLVTDFIKSKKFKNK